MRCRPNHAWKLVSFLYYAKRTYPRERTFFRHIDMNITDFVRSGRGSLALSDEDSRNYTELLLGMYRDIGPWHKRLIDRGYAKDSVSTPIYGLKRTRPTLAIAGLNRSAYLGMYG
ncbi:hypothetical protein N7497_003929 [Penicillium chrysogenum]|nr:hypothetical protein N7497_003929 [Penicillium chrysogenum]